MASRQDRAFRYHLYCVVMRKFMDKDGKTIFGAKCVQLITVNINRVAYMVTGNRNTVIYRTRETKTVFVMRVL